MKGRMRTIRGPLRPLWCLLHKGVDSSAPGHLVAAKEGTSTCSRLKDISPQEHGRFHKLLASKLRLKRYACMRIIEKRYQKHFAEK
jgi:hypothetical protein